MIYFTKNIQVQNHTKNLNKKSNKNRYRDCVTKLL